MVSGDQHGNIFLGKCLLAVLLKYPRPRLYLRMLLRCLFGDDVSWSQTATHAASDKQSLPHVCSVKPAIVPIREFAREKQLPLVKWQLSTGEICLLLPPPQTVFEKGTKTTLLFHQLM